ncbi:MAG: hypothetical protein PHF05_01670 [Candidatus Izemoplasmatales bacterium]|nr:hypothetical protein [Candidatus Izemoplasmatales bacterium]
MKKIFSLFIMVFAMVGFVACNNGGSELDLDLEEEIAFPINLKIEGKVLSWDPVENAKGYIVYANDEKVDQVSETSYDFSDLEGERLIFTVITKAPRGMKNSAHSASIAYIENKEEEIQAVQLALDNSEMDMPEGFAEEIVNKGMLASEFQATLTALLAFEEEMDTVSNPQEFYDSVSAMMDEVSNPEPIISAFVKFSLPDTIQADIDNYELMIQQYQVMIDQYGDFGGYYQDSIDYYNEQILSLEEMLETMDESSDQIVKAVLVVIEYLMQVESMITEDLVTKMIELSETESLADLNPEEVILIKDEIVNILNETLPSVSDVTITINTLFSMSSIVEETNGISLPTMDNTEKMAGTMLLSFEAFIRFIDNFDLKFFQDIKAIGVSEETDNMKEARSSILMINYVDKYLEENETLLDQIEDVYTEEEKEEMFNDYMAELDDLTDSGSAGMVMIYSFSDLTFDQMMNLQVIFDEALNDLLDAFVESEGQLLILQAQITDLEEEFWAEEVNGPDYAEYDFNKQVYQFKIADQVVYLLNSVVSERSLSDYEEVSGFIIKTFLPLVFGSMTDMSMMMEPTITVEDNPMITVLETFMDSTTEEQYKLIQSLVAFLDEKDIFMDYVNDFTDAYSEDYDAIYSDDNQYFQMIFMLSAYDQYMSSSNRDNIDELLTQLGVMFEDDMFSSYELDGYIAAVTSVLDYFDEVASEVADMDFSNLSTEDKARLDVISVEVEARLDTASPY